MRKASIVLFITAFCQVFFVCMNVVFISSDMIIPMLVTGFMISLIWTLNVKRIAIGTWIDRFSYATGAMIGGGIGYWVSTSLTKIL